MAGNSFIVINIVLNNLTIFTFNVLIHHPQLIQQWRRDSLLPTSKMFLAVKLAEDIRRSEFNSDIDIDTLNVQKFNVSVYMCIYYAL